MFRGLTAMLKRLEVPPAIWETVGFISIWISFSSATILFNKWILSEGGFPYPIILTSWHMLFATVVTQVMRRTTNLLPSLNEVPITADFYLKNIVPIGIFFAASLVFSNKAYLYLSVSFIQMLKASTPVVVLLISFIMGLEKPNLQLLGLIVAVSLGVAIASAGEIHFVPIGVIFQSIAVVVESVRLVLVSTLLSANGYKFDALSGLYLYAPVCFVLNFSMFLIFEYPSFSMDALWNLGLGVLLMNAAIAFCLNISVVFLLKHTSSLVFTLSGVIKDILLIVSSSLLFHSSISTLQTFGYSLALTGITLYNLLKLKKALDLQTIFFTATIITLGCVVLFGFLNLWNEVDPATTEANPLKVDVQQ